MKYTKSLTATLLIATIFCGAMFYQNQKTQLAVASLLSEPKTIVIDAGHGGIDGGATTKSGALESNINLEIALKVDDFLSFCGYETIMIRNGDYSIHDDSASTVSAKKVSDLRNRVKMVNDTPNALLLSIHQNMFSDGKYDGAQVFYNKNQGSKQLAETMQKTLIETLPRENHRVAKPAEKVFLMNEVSSPAVLVECGFLSNQEESELLQEDAYQKKITLAIASSLHGWLNEEMDKIEA